ncbi:hypothetical protein COCVIDRAFT_114090, partial [Bipolaris victoriae FI3]
DTEVIATNIEDAPSHEKIDLWQDLAERAGVVKKYPHERGAKNIQYTPHHIQWRATEVSRMKTHKTVVEEAHQKPQLANCEAYFDS